MLKINKSEKNQKTAGRNLIAFKQKKNFCKNFMI